MAGTWTQLAPAYTPDPLDSIGMAWDASRSLIIRAGGNAPGGGSNQSEKWDGTNWATDATTPLQRRNMAVAYDTPRQEVVVFGGVSSGTRFNATFTRGSSWATESPAASPGNRAGAYGAYCAALNKVVIFGGWNGGTTYYDETWSWNGTTWAQITTADAPSPRQNHAICSYGSGVLLFGGNNVTLGLDDTWFFDGTNWTDMAPSTTPPARTLATLAPYEYFSRPILFGGESGSTVYHGDTYSWDGTDWTDEAPATSPEPRSGHGSAWDGVSGGVLIFGGDIESTESETDETWIFQYEAPASLYTVDAAIGMP